jgi:hypothetical protein
MAEVYIKRIVVVSPGDVQTERNGRGDLSLMATLRHRLRRSPLKTFSRRKSTPEPGRSGLRSRRCTFGA